MLIYQNCENSYYKENVHPHSNAIRSQRVEQSTSSRKALTQKNIKFLKNLGFKVKTKKKNKK